MQGCTVMVHGGRIGRHRLQLPTQSEDGPGRCALADRRTRSRGRRAPARGEVAQREQQSAGRYETTAVGGLQSPRARQCGSPARAAARIARSSTAQQLGRVGSGARQASSARARSRSRWARSPAASCPAQSVAARRSSRFRVRRARRPNPVQPGRRPRRPRRAPRPARFDCRGLMVHPTSAHSSQAPASSPPGHAAVQQHWNRDRCAPHGPVPRRRAHGARTTYWHRGAHRGGVEPAVLESRVSRCRPCGAQRRAAGPGSSELPG